MEEWGRYQRQIAFDGLGLDGQRRLSSGRALIAGVGGMGSWAAELLARAGVGFLRLADNDNVDLTNIHRQALFDEADARASRPKVEAAAQRLGRVNSLVDVEPCFTRVDRMTIHQLAEGMDVILDGTDNFATRFLINDYAVKTGVPWILAGVIGAEAQSMAILPGRTPCLRCLFDSPAEMGDERNCRTLGVLGPAVAAIASFQVAEALKLLSGNVDKVDYHLVKFDVWASCLHWMDVSKGWRKPECRCCGQREFEFLEP